jgi:hypothetical protein
MAENGDKQKSSHAAKQIKLGKKMKLRYIPLSELINPFDLCYDGNAKYYGKQGKSYIRTISIVNSRSLKSMKDTDLEALKESIRTYGLLNPLVVAELSEEQRKKLNADNGKYAIIDGQRRFFAIEYLCGLPMRLPLRVWPEKPSKDSIVDPRLIEEWRQAEEDWEVASRVLVPCLVYDYTDIDEMRRHSIEDNKFSVKPAPVFLDAAERLEYGKKFLEEMWPIREKFREEKERAAEERKRKIMQAAFNEGVIELKSKLSIFPHPSREQMLYFEDDVRRAIVRKLSDSGFPYYGPYNPEHAYPDADWLVPKVFETVLKPRKTKKTEASGKEKGVNENEQKGQN